MRKIKFWGTIGILIMILMKPQAAVAAAQQAMGVWYANVAPTLFPFLVLMPMLTGKEACAAYEAMLSKGMRVLFGLPGSAAPVVAIGMIAGSPGGAIALRSMAINSGLKRSEAQRIALALGGVSPAYLIMGVGLSLYGSMKLGMKLACIQMVIQFLLLVVLPRRKEECEEIEYLQEANGIKNPISFAVENLLGICGYMVFFSIVAKVTAAFAGDRIGGYLLLILDLPSGLANLANMKLPGEMGLLCAAIGFGGLCIAFQNMDAHKAFDLPWKDYLKAKCFAGLLFASVGMVLKHSEMRGDFVIFENYKNCYAAALLIAVLMVVPGLYLISIKSFLNKEKCGRKRG